MTIQETLKMVRSLKLPDDVRGRLEFALVTNASFEKAALEVGQVLREAIATSAIDQESLRPLAEAITRGVVDEKVEVARHSPVPAGEKIMDSFAQEPPQVGHEQFHALVGCLQLLDDIVEDFRDEQAVHALVHLRFAQVACDITHDELTTQEKRLWAFAVRVAVGQLYKAIGDVLDAIMLAVQEGLPVDTVDVAAELAPVARRLLVLYPKVVGDWQKALDFEVERLLD